MSEGQLPDLRDAAAVAAEMDAQIQALAVRNTPNVRAIRRRYSKYLREASPDFVLDLARALRDDYGHRNVGNELIHHHKGALQSLGSAELEELGRGINSWWSVDSFALLLAGPAWREGQVGDDLIHRWAHSEDRWWRRAALVSTVALNVKARGGSGDVPRTLQVCRLLVDDRDDMVVKGLSWALRDLVQHDRQAVRDFLAEHDDVLAARVKREVKNKLTTGLKDPRPRGASRRPRRG